MDDGVVRVGYRTVSRSTGDGDVEIGATFFRRLTGVDRQTGDEDGEATRLVQSVFRIESIQRFSGSLLFPYLRVSGHHNELLE